jgi:NAD(P)-dependent dehydrogenase (short-subunit alcohol dehydrogenase family)
MQAVLITGVSTGIGHATTVALLQRGYRVFGSVRREEDAQSLGEELGDRFTPLLFDVTDSAAIASAVSSVEQDLAGAGLHALINNAGIVLPGPLPYMPLADFRVQIEVNLIGLLDVTQHFLPLLGARADAPHPPGRIINVSSVSGRIGYPFMGGYAASKHGLEGLSDVLRRELMLYGIDVIVVEPGTTRTPIKEKYAAQIRRYADTDYGAFFAGLEKQLAERETTGLPVEKVVDVLLTAVESPRPKARYAVPRKWLSGWFLPRLLPDRWLDRLVARRLGL